LLFLAKVKDGSWSSTQTISKKFKIPQKFLAKIINALSRARIIETQRGKTGGVRLLNKEVSVADVIKLLNLRFSLNKCLGKGFTCFLKKTCPTHKLFKLVEKELFEKLNAVTIAQLI